jgi:hypothetical protein
MDDIVAAALGVLVVGVEFAAGFVDFCLPSSDSSCAGRSYYNPNGELVHA